MAKAKGVELASAYISLSVSTDDVPRQVEKALGKAKTDKVARKAGERIGKQVDEGAAKTFGPATARALTKELRAAGDKGSQALLKELAAGGRDAERQASMAGRNYANALRDSMNGGGTEAAQKWEKEFRSALNTRDAFREFNKPVKVKVDKREVDNLSSDLFKLARSDVFKLNIGAAAITSLPMLASGLAEVAAGIQQVAQAGLALPGIMAGATASIGTLVFGATGVADAYDAMNKAADDAAKSGSKVASQQRAQQSSSYGLRNAIVDEAEARKDVNRAIRDTQRDLQDLNLEMRGGQISEQRAILEAQKARERLYSGDFSDYRDALLDVQEADLRVEETKARNVRTAEELNEANAKGIANADRVVSANERWIRSQQGVAQAQGAVAAASETTSAAQENAALAMSKLSPEAQDFVNALMDVSGPFQTLRNLVQGNIFRGMDDELKSLTSKSMPMLEQGLGGLGDAWNRTFAEIFRVAGEDDTQGILSRIFGNTEEAQNILTGGIDPLVEGLGVLSEAGSRALPRMAEGFVTLADRFADFITQADESGKLDEWINDGITALGHLGETALNVGKMFTAITNVTDGTFLENLESWTNSWQTWLNSAEGQETLTDLFDEGKRIFQEWKPILEDIPGLFRGIYDGASVWIGAVREVVAPITEFLKDHPDLVKTAAMAYLAFKSAQVLDSFTGLLTMFSTTLPDAASTSGDKAAKGFTGKFNTAMKTAGWVAIGAMVSDQLLKGFDDQFKTKFAETGLPGSGMWFLHLITDPMDTLKKTFPFFFGNGDGPKLTPGAPGIPYGPNQGPGARQTPLGPGAAIPPGMPSYMPGQNPLNIFSPKPGESARDFAHRQMMPYWQSQGLEVGDHAADQYGEHQNGALDIMVDSIEEGNRILSDILADPNVYGAIFNNQAYGYGQGAGPRPYSGGFTGNPTQDHQDHVHVWYKPGASGNIVPPRPVGPRLGPPMPGGPVAPPPVKTPLDQFLEAMGVPRYDTGGWWPNNTLGMNTTGQPEYVLTPQDIEFLQNQGIDPASLQHGTTGGAAPGPNQALMPASRTEGYIPAAAGNTAPVGQGGISSFLDLGESAIHGLIDTGAQLGSMAVSAAAAAGSFGAGAAAGPAASTAIMMGAEAAKRGVSYGYDMAGIWAEALVEQAFPFGAPRWLGSADPMAFMPQGIPGLGEKKAPGTMGAAKTAIQSWAQPGNPAMAAMGNGRQGGQAALQAARQQPSYKTAPPQYGPPTAAPPVDLNNPMAWLQGAVFDQGGVLNPGTVGVNLSNRPEAVFTGQQFRDISKMANNWETVKPAGGDTIQFYSQDVQGMFREYQKNRRRESRTHAGRP